MCIMSKRELINLIQTLDPPLINRSNNRYAAEAVLNGTKRKNARHLLERNRYFIPT